MTIVGNNPDVVVGGVDTHADVHVAAVVNHVGGVFGVEAFATTHTGNRQLVSWLRSHGELVAVERFDSHFEQSGEGDPPIEWNPVELDHTVRPLRQLVHDGGEVPG